MEVMDWSPSAKRAVMEEETAARRGSGNVRSGRPPRELAGEVEERILDAAKRVFLERGFEGASIDEIAEVARAGKPTIYARFPGKEALFAAVVARKVRENTTFIESIAPNGAALEERLASTATALLRRVLAADTVGLCRATIAEARRFPDLAASVYRMARARTSEAVAQLLGDVPEAGKLPGFALDHPVATAQYFTELIVLPLLMRALFGEDLTALRAEIDPHVARTVAFFLTGCRHGGVD
jgi:AcrR family transcriptional regulator